LTINKLNKKIYQKVGLHVNPLFGLLKGTLSLLPIQSYTSGSPVRDPEGTGNPIGVKAL